MPDFRRVHCQGCDQPASKVGAISWGGLCRGCGKDRQDANVDGLMAMNDRTIETTLEQRAAGRLVRDRWRRGMLASIAPQLLDQLEHRK